MSASGGLPMKIHSQDGRATWHTLSIVGREDRATLRSDPSARADAGTSKGAPPPHAMPPLTPPCIGKESDKPNSLPPQAVCQLATFPGLIRGIALPGRGLAEPVRLGRIALGYYRLLLQSRPAIWPKERETDTNCGGNNKEPRQSCAKRICQMRVMWHRAFT